MFYPAGISDVGDGGNGNAPVVCIVGATIAPPPLNEYYIATSQVFGYSAEQINPMYGVLSNHFTDVNDGNIVGNALHFDGMNEPLNRAFILQNDLIQQFPVIGNINRESRAEGINRLGLVVGSADFGNGISSPYLWDTGANSVIQIGGNLQGRAVAVNDHGRVVGHVVQGDFSRAFTYQQNGTFEFLELPHSASLAVDVNNSGDIVGTWINETGVAESFFTSSAGLLTTIDPLGGYAVFAEEVNDNGFVVGKILTASTGFEAFIWHETFGTRFLSDLIEPGSDWDLRGATAISESGYIAGYGFNPAGEYRAFLLQPVPCPQTAMVVLGFFIPGLLRRERKTA
jgi:uncharacterized membrane protein